MTKEMFVSSTPHETKVAVVEDDQLAEIFFERENEYTLAGSIYKGRVTRVLPGMQSAFVDIGLERDAFLYVSDFLDLEEEDEEFEQLPTKPEVYVTNRPQPEARTYEVQKQFQPPVAIPKEQAFVEEEEGEISETVGETGESGDAEGDRNGFRGRRRRRGRRGRGFPESKFARGSEREEPRHEMPVAEDFAPAESYEPIVLPGESISKYRRPEKPYDTGHDTRRAPQSSAAESNAAPFTIEGGFDDSEPDFVSSDALKEFAEPQGRVESEFAPEATQPSEPETRSIVQRNIKVPFVLPGESISKYNRAEAHAEQKASEQTAEEVEKEVAAKADSSTPELAEPIARAIETPTFVPPPVRRAYSVPAPLVLPGESLAKYKQKPVAAPAPTLDEPAGSSSAAEQEPANEIPQPEAAAEAVVSEAPFESPMAEEGKPEEEGERRPQRKPKQEGPRTEVRMEGRNTVAPFVLPGESIAKYRNRGAVAEKPMEDAHDRELRQEIERQPQEELAETAAQMVSDNEPLAVTLDRELERESAVEPAPAQSLDVAEQSKEETEPVVAEHGAVGGTTEPAPAKLEHPEEFAAEVNAERQERYERPVEPDSETRHRYEQMNVAATFGGEAAEEPVAEEDASSAENGQWQGSSITESETTSYSSEEDQPIGESAGYTSPAETVREPESDEERHGYSASAGHTLEQEEIEDEESEYHPYSEEDEQDSYVELEEETLERSAEGGHRRREYAKGRSEDQVEGANGLTDAVHDAIIDEETTEAAYPESATLEDDGAIEIDSPDDLSDEDDDEFEESELEAEGAEEHAPEHVDTRTGGYPQRPQRPGYDRRGGRGRRGGKRMRGGPRRESPRPVPLISDLLKEGQEVVIQIAKEPIGKKGARITSHIALPGRYLVYMPTVNHIGVSRKINSDEERQRLKRIMLSEREGGHGGFIVRTAAEGITEEELRADIRFLKNLWHDIKTRAENSKAPALIYHDLNLVERVLRDQVTADFSNIWVDTEQEYERILRFAQRFQPQLVRKVKLYTKSTPLYEQFGIKDEIDKALKSKVWLKSGGYIVINQTEALVAIDINTGKYVGKTARLEDTIVKTNVDAIKEIVRQIRLRDLGGIIVIDFIDMDERKNRQRVMQALEEAMKSDRAPSKVLAFNDFGLVAITRKRVKQSLERTLGEPCPYCTGTGLVKALNTVCNEIYLEMRKMTPQFEQKDVVLRVNPEVAKALKANGGKWIQEIEDLTRKTILVKSDPLLHQEIFDIQA